MFMYSVWYMYTVYSIYAAPVVVCTVYEHEAGIKIACGQEIQGYEGWQK